MRACTAVLAAACPVEGCEQDVTEVGHGGGSVFFECEAGHFLTIPATELHELMED